MSGNKLYVGNLREDVQREELEKVFGAYGELRQVWVSFNPPGYAFIDFEDPRDAKDAVKDLDRRTVLGSRIRVEFSHRSGPGRHPSPGARHRESSARRRPYSPSHRCYECGERGHYAYDCEIRLRRYRRVAEKEKYGGGGRSPSVSRGGRRRRSRSRSSGRRNRYQTSRSNSVDSPRGRRRSPSYDRSRRRSPSPAVAHVSRRRSPRRSLSLDSFPRTNGGMVDGDIPMGNNR